MIIFFFVSLYSLFKLLSFSDSQTQTKPGPQTQTLIFSDLP